MESKSNGRTSLIKTCSCAERSQRLISRSSYLITRRQSQTRVCHARAAFPFNTKRLSHTACHSTARSISSKATSASQPSPCHLHPHPYDRTCACGLPTGTPPLGGFSAAVLSGRFPIALINHAFSSLNWSSSVRSSRNFGKNLSKRCLFMIRNFCTSYDLFGLAAKICRILAKRIVGRGV